MDWGALAHGVWMLLALVGAGLTFLAPFIRDDEQES